MLTLATQYQAFGFNLVPLGNDKRPVVTGGTYINKRTGKEEPIRFRWQDWTEKKQPDNYFDKVSSFDWWADVKGLAAVCGPISGDLVCVDFDSAKSEGAVLAFLDALGIRNEWIVESPGGGYHVWLRCPGLNIPKGKLDRPGIDAAHVELRYTGHYVALPGSQHPNGGVYAFVGETPTEAPPVVAPETLLRAYDAVTMHEDASTPKTQENGATEVTEAYVRAALDAELVTLARTPNGSRNEQLNRSAFALGQLVADGLLSEDDVIGQLEAVALSVGLEEAETAHTILSGFRAGQKEPRGLRLKVYSNGHDAPDLNGSGDAQFEEEPKRHNPWPYGILAGRIVLYEMGKDDEVKSKEVADFTARITQEIVAENGDKTFVIEGEGKRGDPFRLEVPADVYGEDRRLKSLLEAAAGSLDGTYAGMVGHLGPAIKKLSTEVTQIRRFHRVGWSNGLFMIPGKEPGGIQIELDRRLPYEANAGAELGQGLWGLQGVIESVGPERTTVILSHLLTGPLARPAGWRNERYALFVKGLTGTFKTSVTQALMCIYGEGFARDDRLLKWGEGATRNALMQMATSAHDMPLFVDNFKPNTGGGTADFVNLIHAIMEGGEKARLNRASQMIETRPIFCWPLFTGEDVPDNDAASLARILVVPFERQAKRTNAGLTQAQAQASHLPAVGRAWIEWLEGEGQAVAARWGKALPEKRAQWADFLFGCREDLANPMRVATNLALNELAYLIACEHPSIGALLCGYHAQHLTGLTAVATQMAESTAEGIEALRFLSILRELLATGRALLVEKQLGTPAGEYDRERHIGWLERDGSAYLLPNVTINLIERHAKERFYSANQLYAQLEDLGFIASSDKGTQKTKRVSIAGEKYRTLHIKREAIEEE